MTTLKLNKERGYQIGGATGKLVRTSELTSVDVYVVEASNGEQKTFKTRLAALNYMYKVYSAALARCLENVAGYTVSGHEELQQRYRDVSRIHRYINEETKKGVS